MRYNIPYIRARLLFKQKYVYADGAIVEMKAWAVPKSSRTPEGFKYSLVYINDGGQRMLGYDNAEGKGHHRHQGNVETPITFDSMQKLIERFLGEIEEIRGVHNEGQEHHHRN